MNEIGLDLNHEGYVTDQDDMNMVVMEGKLLKYSFETPIPINRNIEIYFDPLNNLQLMSNLFSYLLKKLEIYENVYFPTYFSVKNELYQNALVVKNDYTTIQTAFYTNITLAYAEMMFIINGGSTIDLSQLDKKNLGNSRR